MWLINMEAAYALVSSTDLKGRLGIPNLSCRAISRPPVLFDLLCGIENDCDSYLYEVIVIIQRILILKYLEQSIYH